MQTNIKFAFCNNPNLDKRITAFLMRDPEYTAAERAFFEIAEELARLVGFERYDILEQRLGACMGRAAELHYLFGLGLRQELIAALNL